MHEVIIVGTSIAGFAAAAELRSGGFTGTIRMVGEEPTRTYERPPLSKGVLAGEDEASTAWAAAHDDDLDLDWLLCERATALEPTAQTVTLGSGDTLHYDGLVIATGATPRRLPGQDDFEGIHVMRTLDDSLALRADLDSNPDRVVVIGGGFIGAEVAATCRRRGVDVTLIEPLDHLLLRGCGSAIGAIVGDLHRSEGVDLRLGIGVAGFEGDERVRRVRLTDGSSIDADVVVVGIGVIPNTDWLAGSGLPVDDGVVADATLLVAPGIVAAGDVARWDSPRYGPIRIEHWDNAVDMGRAAGRRLLTPDADAVAFDPVPWFWSDQYDVRIQVAGRAEGEMVITDGSVADGKFVAVFGQDGQVRGALGWNWPAKVVRYRMALENGLAWADVVGA